MSKAQAAEFKAKGNAALAASNFDEAIENYTKAIDLDASDHVFFSNRSAAYLSKGDAEHALADAEACVSLKPDWSKGFGRKGAALYALKQFDEAISAYEKGLEVEPASEALKSALDEVRTAKAEAAAPKRGMPGNLFGPDMFARLAGHPKFSTYLKDPMFVQRLQMIQMNPSSLGSGMNDPRLMEVIGFLLGIPLNAASGAPGEDMPSQDDDVPMPAHASTPAAAAAPPPSAPPKEETPEEAELRAKTARAAELKSAATAHYRKREFPDALRLYIQGQEANPDKSDISFLLNQAAVYFETDDVENCVKVCEEAIATGRDHRAPFPMIAKAFARIGNAHAKVSAYDAAIAAYESSLVESHTDEVYEKLKKIRVTKRKAEEAAYLDPVKAEEAKQRGNELFKAGKFRESIEEYSEAIKRKPDDAVYYCNRATARTKVMDFRGAMDDCTQAIKLNPNYPKAYSRKGALEFLQKEYHKAMESYKKGIELDPENDECKDGLARTIAKINESQAAGGDDTARAERAMADPEIQAILRDPMVQTALQDLGRNPEYARQVMNDPVMSAKISKLIAAGVVKTK